MGAVVFGLDESPFLPQDYKISATTVSGAVALRETSTTVPGEVKDATTTAFADMLGLYAEAVTYTATPVAGDRLQDILTTGLEGVVRIITSPMAMYEFFVAGSATAGAALATTAPANVLTNSTADSTGLTISDTNVGTVSMSGGMIKGRTGANMGLTRRLTAHTNNVSTAVTVAFPKTIAVNDTFTRVPFSKAGVAMQLTSDLTQVNGIIATGTGGSVVVYRVRIGIDPIPPGKDVVLIVVKAGNHFLNRYA